MKYFILSTLIAAKGTNAFTSPRPILSTRPLILQKMVQETEERSGVFSDEVQQEAKEVLQKVGWAAPIDDGEMTSEDPFVQQIDAGIQEDFGFGLDDLLNPAKVVNLERDLYNLRLELASMTGNGELDIAGLSTAECDVGGGGEDAAKLREEIGKKETELDQHRLGVGQLEGRFEPGNQNIVEACNEPPHKEQRREGTQCEGVTLILRVPVRDFGCHGKRSPSL